ncbi:MAG TPA: DUF721 domain-containing protein [Gammaproteobacteria bacterium]|nr:DUF721 domain-containing protein [Gammaproteobacteria bacterium]
MKKVSEIQILSVGNIYQKVSQLTLLQKEVRNFLPDELRMHCSVANFEKGILVFAVESSAWAMRFRFVVTELLAQLRKEGKLHQLSSIEYYVEPDFLNLFKEEFL